MPEKLSKIFQKSLYNMPENRILLHKNQIALTEAMQLVSISAEYKKNGITP